jgi:NADPH-dependent 2,4-dienoyl-CoA reductase/sulfur reductase-like enzyme
MPTATSSSSRLRARASGARVWAVGDCCEVRHRVTRDWVFLPLGTHANKQGKVVGDNLVGGDARFGGVLGTAITRFVHGRTHVEIARTGLSSREAAVAGFDAVALVTDGRTASGYMPEARRMATNVIVDRGTRRLLGVQIVGGDRSAKRIDTAAAALWGELTVDDLAGMDLAYAPPFATVWEALQLASRRAADRL